MLRDVIEAGKDEFWKLIISGRGCGHLLETVLVDEAACALSSKTQNSISILEHAVVSCIFGEVIICD
jgi:hypothetical protein